MQKRTIFPYRRPGQKRRVKNAGGGHKGKDAARRLPGAPRELLPLLQPTTKALAQMLSGKSRASGQLAHARNVLAQAQRMIDDKLLDRLGPADREEFLEQVARLKLTVADAEAEAVAEEEVERGQTPPPAPREVGRERLREMAMALSKPADDAPAPAAPDGDEPEPEPATAEVDGAAEPTGPATPPEDWTPPRSKSSATTRLRRREGGRERSGNGERLRLRQPAEDGEEHPDGDDERAAS